jgi:hypothetical protein
MELCFSYADLNLRSPHLSPLTRCLRSGPPGQAAGPLVEEALKVEAGQKLGGVARPIA